MKVEIINDALKEGIKYPYIGIHPKTKSVVLFTSKGTGTILFSPEEPENVGRHRSYADVENNFVKFNGQLLMSND